MEENKYRITTYFVLLSMKLLWIYLSPTFLRSIMNTVGVNHDNYSEILILCNKLHISVQLNLKAYTLQETINSEFRFSRKVS